MNPPITERGIFFGMDCDVYFADPCPTPSLSNSLIAPLLDFSPAHAARKHPKLAQSVADRKKTAQMHRGSVGHRLALGAGKDFVVIDAKDFRTDKAKAERDEAEANNLVPILAEKFAEAEKQAKIVRRHIDELTFGEHWEPEVVIAWQEDSSAGPIWCRGMIDLWCPSLLLAVDLKFTTNASEAAATRRMADGGYDTQNAFYSRGLGRILQKYGQVRFATLFSENDEPFDSQSFELSEGWQTVAWDTCEDAIELWGKCLHADSWPSYPRTSKQLLPPPWLVSKRIATRYRLEESE